MIRFKLTLFAVMVFALACANPAFAQSIAIVQGNGQAICDGCAFGGSYNTFDPMVVRVTDASGKPVAGATVTWTVTTNPSGQGFLDTLTTTTGSDTSATATLCTAIGQTCNTYHGGGVAGITLGFGFLQSGITASLTNGQAVAFVLTQSPNPQLNTFENLNPLILAPAVPFQFTGTTGGTSSTSLTAQVFTVDGKPVPFISVRFIPGDTVPAGAASISCATGAGADPGSVLTDSTGNATCKPVFGSVPSTGQLGPFYACFGGVPVIQNPANAAGRVGLPGCFSQLGPYNILVTPATPGGVQIISGNNQSGNRSQALAAPLVVKVVDQNGSALGGQQVTWTVSPATAANLSPATGTTDANGLVSTAVTLNSSAAGTIQVKATTSNGISQTFTITVNVQITGISPVIGTGQSAPAGTNFGQALVVQVATAAGQSPGGITVQFSSSGVPVTLSAASATTDSSGRAQVAVQAGATPGAATVTANVGTVSTSFALTVIPLGPAISAILNGAGFFASSGANQTALSPCGVGTIVTGSALSALPATPNMFAAPTQQDTGVRITFASATAPTPVAAPILNVTSSSAQQLITFQVPCELIANSYTVTVTINGGSKDIPFVPVRPGAPGIFEIPYSDKVRRAILVRPDGSFVSLQNPARKGEMIRMYITGGGPTQPSAISGSLPTPGVDILPSDPNQIVVGVNNSGVGAVNARLAPELIGVWEVTFVVPANAPSGNDVVLSVGVTALDPNPQYSQGSKISIQ
ncbi:MAG: hypothetical protein C5B51_05505 [Terriglobia bacterium]|nr:MAG: hypothetical protein C5B51_05505 [Terriglobia bacterium]